MPARSVASWNALILELAEMVDVIDVAGMWELVRQMQSEAMKPDSFTISTILTLCSFDDWNQKPGKQIHCFVLRNNLGMDSDFHGEASGFGKVSFWWYVENGEDVESLKLFQEMTLRDGTMPNKITLSESASERAVSLYSMDKGKGHLSRPIPVAKLGLH
ncbi:hypothetical protein C4D60_Mb11t18940 [Musa balbisiana]|uniref:Pentatricopeptide repeat-containing protein n=1 Tax=Musa balbisiana TaxID=52838 RepID=A0A4S8J565_MUSBA|nr:hypothetical protein C4D60_Mb11t18940 [Musa balbisiana]